MGPLQAFQQATLLHGQGRLLEAEQLYQIVLRSDKRHIASINHLGLIRIAQTNFEDGARLFRKIIKIDKNSADAHHNLAFSLTGLGCFEEAVRSYQKALAIRPNFPEAHNNLGHALERLGQFEKAIENFEHALLLAPHYAEAHNNLGNILHLLGRSEDAIECYEKAIATRADYVEAYRNLGIAFMACARNAEAIKNFEKALAIRPHYVEAYNSIGNALRVLGRQQDALDQYGKALAIKPDHADAQVNFADTLEALGRTEEALVQYDKALTTRPDEVELLYKRGHALRLTGRLDEAVTQFEKVLAVAPDHIQAFDGLVHAIGDGCDWARRPQVSRQLAARVVQGKWVEPFSFLGYCDDSQLQLASAMLFVRTEVPLPLPRLWTGRFWKNEKIRVGYLSAGFQKHPMAYLTAELFEIHDRSRFEVLAFSLGPDDHSEIRSRLIRGVDQFHDVRSNSDREIATLIHDLQVDIVVDRSGYTTNARPGILAYRPAPIQVNYLGFPGTLGADFYDYVIADPKVLPFDQQPFYMEKIVHLPDCYQVNDTKRAIAETPTRQEAGLPAHAFVFCCFNNDYKITPQMFDIWMRLLTQVDQSVLWLLGGNATTEKNLRNEAQRRGVDPARLIFAGRKSLEEHLARHRLADLFLDTLPYNAHTTASDALWTGLPLVTCYGKSFAGRVAASLLMAVGLPELVTGSLEDYESLGIALARDPSLLGMFRVRLARNRLIAPLFNTDRYRGHIEAAYTTMWDIWQRGQRPRSFAVDRLPDGH